MALVITINTTAAQDAKLAAYLQNVNNRRIADGVPPYASIEDLYKEFLIETIKNAVNSLKINKAESLRSAYLNASDAVQDQVDALLGVGG